MNLFALDAKEYAFEPAIFDLVVMFYHLDRDVCSHVLSTLKPGGFLICKSSVCWNSYEGIAPANSRPLSKGEILSLFPELVVLHHEERQVRDRGVAEYVGKKRR